MAKRKLNVQVVISGLVNELIAKLHNTYPHRERSGIARIEKKEGYYLVTDIRFPKQSNAWAETEMSQAGLQELLEDIFNTDPTHMHEWKCRLHSHHSMGCFRSGTDETAKCWFNDGMQDHRWSIVTAYTTKGTLSYKCALNVFKPVNIEFDVPVIQQEFDMESYLQKNMKDYTVYKKALQTLEASRDAKLAQLQQPYAPTQAEVDALIDIFNVESTDEVKAICTDILSKNGKDRNKLAITHANEEFEEMAEELLEYCEWDIFSKKLKELQENIIAPTYAQQYAINTPTQSRKYWDDIENKKQTPLFGDEDMKYKNHTTPKESTAFKDYNDYDDRYARG